MAGPPCDSHALAQHADAVEREKQMARVRRNRVKQRTAALSAGRGEGA